MTEVQELVCERDLQKKENREERTKTRKSVKEPKILVACLYSSPYT